MGKDVKGERTPYGVFMASLALFGTFYTMNKAYEKMGLRSPVQSIWDLIPGFSTLRYGAPLVFSIPINAAMLSMEKDEYKRTILKNKLIQGGATLFPMGGQARKTIAGVRANIEGGVKDKKGKYKYRIEGGFEKLRSLAFGPSGTRAAQTYYKIQDEKRNKKSNSQTKGFLKFAP